MATSVMSKCISTAKTSSGLTIRQADTITNGAEIEFGGIMTTIAIVGDYKAGNLSHVATGDAVGHCSAALGLAVEHRWVGTEELARPEGTKRLAEFGGFWIAPGSPYKSMSGALSAIRMAREQWIPLLGTCGGF